MKKLIIDYPILADFNSQDEDGAVRLFFPLQSAINLKILNMELNEGDYIWLTDGDVEVKGNVSKRNIFWVVLPTEKYKDVDEKSPYHTNNTHKIDK